jgi:hypothetical protein
MRTGGGLTGPPDRLTKFTDRFLILWYRFIHRIGSGWGRLTDGFLVGWYRYTQWLGGGRARPSDHRAGRSDLAGSSRTPIFVAATLAILLAVPVIALIRVRSTTSEDTNGAVRPSQAAVPSRQSPSGPGAFTDGLPGFNVHVNDQAGYLFSYPDGWALSESGETSLLVSPDGDVVMSFGVAPSGSLRQAADQVVQDLTTRYADVELVAGQVERTQQGHPSLVVGGRATDAGSPVRFLVITIRGSDRNRAITIHFAGETDPLTALPDIQEIVGSFRIPEPAA